jgi:hypothetical protein
MPPAGADGMGCMGAAPMLGRALGDGEGFAGITGRGAWKLGAGAIEGAGRGAWKLCGGACGIGAGLGRTP